jgi:hypothetical protein
MKKINILKLSAIILLLIVSCETPDNAIYNVLDNTNYGAALRKIDTPDDGLSKNFNVFDLESTFEVIIEEQDEQNGKLLSKVDVYIAFTDVENDGANNKTELLAKTIPASSFTIGDKGLPTTHIIISFQEALDTLGMVNGDYSGGDKFPIRLELTLTDGRTFSTESTSDSLQQSYWASSFGYISKILCIPDTPITGDYLIKMHDSYDDGWQGSKIIATIDGVENYYFINSQYDAGSTPPYDNQNVTATIPVNATTLEWSFVAGDWPSEVSFEIYGPNSGEIIGAFGPSPDEGTLSLNLCKE